MAQGINESILASSEGLLETQSDRSHVEILQNAEKLVSGARDRLLQARRQVAQIQSQAESDDAGIASNSSNRRFFGARVTDNAGHLRSLSAGLNESKLRADLELEFAEKSFQMSIAMISDLQAVEVRRPHHLVAISKPSLPDYSTYPRRLASVLTVLTFSFLIMGIGTMTWAAIREHARV
jgi:capsule polysaccharide export protein KpsE/RkpR